MPLLLATLKTPLGALHLLADHHILIGANFSSVDDLQVPLDSVDRLREIRTIKTIPIITELLQNYFDGDIAALNSITVRQNGAVFSQAAWKAMRKVPAGKTITYADLAAKSGSPAAVRAAGTACAKNSIVLVVPCHRIVKTGGALGNYAYGLDKKEWLLNHEGALL